MHCEKFETRLQDLLDARLRPECDKELLAHAETCEACREIMALQEQLFAGLEIWEAPAVPDCFTQHTVALAMAAKTLPTVEPRAPRISLAWIGLSVVLAASLVLAIIPFFQHNQPSNGAAPLAQDEPIPKPAMVDVVVAPMPQPLVASEVPNLLDTHPVTFTPQQLAAEGEVMLRNLQQLPEVPVDQSVERIPGFRPIANTFGLAIDVMRKVLPGGRESTTSQEQKTPPATKPQAEWLGNSQPGSLA